MVALASRVYQSSHASWAVACGLPRRHACRSPRSPRWPGWCSTGSRSGPCWSRRRPRETVVALALTRLTGTGAILGLSVGFGLCAAVLQPGLGAIVPQLAGRAGVTRANGYLQAATWGGFTVGPLLAGVLTAAGGTGLALGAVAAVYGLGAVGLRLLRLAAGPAGLAGAATPGPGHARPRARRAGQLSAGLRFLRADRGGRPARAGGRDHGGVRQHGQRGRGGLRRGSAQGGRLRVLGAGRRVDRGHAGRHAGRRPAAAPPPGAGHAAGQPDRGHRGGAGGRRGHPLAGRGRLRDRRRWPTGSRSWPPAAS